MTFLETNKYYEVTSSKKTLLELSQELNVEKFGILDDEGDWNYISDKSIFAEYPRFSFDTGIYGEETEPSLENTRVCDLKLQSIYDNGSVVNHKIIKVLAYKC